MLVDILKDYKVVLASKSPRRQELLSDLDIEFDVLVPNVDESYPDTLNSDDVAEYISRQKAEPFVNSVDSQTIVITSDTVVVVGDNVLGKPKDRNEAVKMLEMLSGVTHKVISAVSIVTSKGVSSFSDVTLVNFRALTSDEIDYYIDNYSPFDKAGGYGIQEWIGYVAIDKIEGSYFNVVGLPVEKLYRKLNQLLSTK